MTEDLLPPNASVQERALSLATKRVGEVACDVASLWNPNTCPADLLPWLAWALHIDRWDAGWTETQKRQVVAASFAVHKVKGTVGAVKRVANSFGVGVAITEWQDQSPPGSPYTFTALISVPTISMDTQQSIVDAIMNTKPVRASASIQVVNTLDLKVGLPTYARLGTLTRFQASLN